MDGEINNALEELNSDPSSTGGATVLGIQDHKWKEGQLLFSVEWTSEECT